MYIKIDKPDITELGAIKLFCTEEAHRKSVRSQAAESVKSLRLKQKEVKTFLTKYIADIKCVALTKDDMKKYTDLCIQSSIEPMPPILRLVRTNKDSSVSPETVQEAVESLSEEDLKESDGRNHIEIVKNAILKNVRRLIRSYTDSLRLMRSLPRSESLYDIQDAPEEVAAKMFLLWSTEQEIKKSLQDKEEASSADLIERVESYFIRSGITAQRVVVEGRTYRLVRRVSVKRPKVGIGRFETMLSETLSILLKDTSKFEPMAAIRQLQIQVTSEPSTTKSLLSLCHLAD
jgi:DNA-binding transcriptional regulator YhcF (GntR family)